MLILETYGGWAVGSPKEGPYLMQANGETCARPEKNILEAVCSRTGGGFGMKKEKMLKFEETAAKDEPFT